MERDDAGFLTVFVNVRGRWWLHSFLSLLSSHSFDHQTGLWPWMHCKKLCRISAIIYALLYANCKHFLWMHSLLFFHLMKAMWDSGWISHSKSNHQIRTDKSKIMYMSSYSLGVGRWDQFGRVTSGSFTFSLACHGWARTYNWLELNKFFCCCSVYLFW